jgi:hypothetical protein
MFSVFISIRTPAATVTKAANQAVIHIYSIPATPMETTGKIMEDLISDSLAEKQSCSRAYNRMANVTSIYWTTHEL